MERKTQGVYVLVQTVLETFTPPYSTDVIEDVFLAIEGNSIWQQTYDTLVAELTKMVVNNWIGNYTKQITGMQTVREVPAKRSRLIKDYSQLR